MESLTEYLNWLVAYSIYTFGTIDWNWVLQRALFFFATGTFLP
jgi:hypothetical protein